MQICRMREQIQIFLFRNFTGKYPVISPKYAAFHIISLTSSDKILFYKHSDCFSTNNLIKTLNILSCTWFISPFFTWKPEQKVISLGFTRLSRTSLMNVTERGSDSRSSPRENSSGRRWKMMLTDDTLSCSLFRVPFIVHELLILSQVYQGLKLVWLPAQLDKRSINVWKSNLSSTLLVLRVLIQFNIDEN